MEVLEQGRPEAPTSRRRALVPLVVTAVLVVLVIAAGAAAVRWWSEQAALPDALGVVSMQVIGPARVSVADGESGWPGGLGTPDGTGAPAVQVRLSIDGDPQREVQISAAQPGTGVLVSGMPPTTIPRAGSVSVDLTVAPSDCFTAGMAPRELLVDSAGGPVPVSDTVSDELASQLAALCVAAGPAPTVVVQSALIDAFFRDRSLVMTADLRSLADRTVLTPLDGTALRGLGAQEVEEADEGRLVRLRWLISPGEMTPNTSLTGRVQAYSVFGGIAYPWIIVVPAPRDLEVRTSMALTPLRNDGVDLAEVAPRPAG